MTLPIQPLQRRLQRLNGLDCASVASKRQRHPATRGSASVAAQLTTSAASPVRALHRITRTRQTLLHGDPMPCTRRSSSAVRGCESPGGRRPDSSFSTPVCLLPSSCSRTRTNRGFLLPILLLSLAHAVHGQCRPWCYGHPSSWEQKCHFARCKGCPPCLVCVDACGAFEADGDCDDGGCEREHRSCW